MKPGMIVATVAAATLLIAQDAPVGAAVEGTVVNSATGAGIDGASVTFFTQTSRYMATSDAVGHFKITDMTPGNYRASAEKDGFASPAIDLGSLLSDSGVRVVSGPDPVRVELKLTPLSRIRGRVLGPDSKPVAGVEVNLNPNMLGHVVTDQEGRFEFEEIKPGSYTLSARPPGTAAPVEAKDGTKTAMVTTYYPSAADKSLAEQIVFRGEGDLEGYEIRMQTAPVHRVRGIVVDEEGKPAPGATVGLFPDSQAPPGPVGLSRRAGGPSLFLMGARFRNLSERSEAAVTSGKDGRFEFPAVASGDWKLIVESYPSGAADARVRAGDVDDVQIHVAKPIKLIGTIEWQDPEQDPGRQQGSNPPFLVGLVNLVTEDNELVIGGLAESGRISWEHVLPGRYKVVPTPGLSPRIFLGETEVTGQPFAIAANGPPLRIVLKTWSGTVRGTVEKGEGATVVLVPQQSQAPGMGQAIGQAIRCGSGGSFELTEVSPGDYYIAAFDRMDGLSPSPAMLSLLPSRGTSVRVEQGSAADVMLSVISTPR